MTPPAGKSDKNDIVFFVPRGGSRDVAVKDLNAIVAPPGATEPNYTYTVIVLTPDSNGTRNKVLHSLDPTVIIRDS